MKKILFIVAFRNFRDEEFFVPKEILEKNGIEIKVASTQKGLALGADGGSVEVDYSLDEIKIDDFDAFVFIGGPGMVENLDNPSFQTLAKEAFEKNKFLAAICIAPALLAKAGVLKGKKATVWSSALNRHPIKILEENGAIYQDQNVVVDGNLITANGPTAAKEFGEKILEIIKKEN